MTERELVDVLDRKAAVYGVRPVLESLMEWVNQGFRLSLLEAIEDAFPEGLAPDPGPDPGPDPEDGGAAGPVWGAWQRPLAQ